MTQILPFRMPEQSRQWAVVDASVWVSRLIPSDAHHQASRTWLTNHLRSAHMIVAPALLMTEIGGALARRTGDEPRTRRVVATLARIPSIRWVPLSLDLAQQSAEVALTLRLRGADAIYVALADRLNISLITWDNEQLTRGAALVSVRTP